MHVIFKDDMKDQKKILIIVMALALVVVVQAILMFFRQMIAISGLIIMILIAMIPSFFLIYLLLYVTKYSVTICDNTLSVKSLHKTQSVELAKGLKYVKNELSRWKYGVVVISVNEIKISIITKKLGELTDILSEYGDEVHVPTK